MVLLGFSCERDCVCLGRMLSAGRSGAVLNAEFDVLNGTRGTVIPDLKSFCDSNVMALSPGDTGRCLPNHPHSSAFLSPHPLTVLMESRLGAVLIRLSGLPFVTDFSLS